MRFSTRYGLVQKRVPKSLIQLCYQRGIDILLFKKWVTRLEYEKRKKDPGTGEE